MAETPPRGWSSGDASSTTIDEATLLANAAAVQQHLLPHGYEYVTVGGFWYQDAVNASRLVIDGHGRLQPDPTRFPSSAGGLGFKPLADRIHAMGLKFGVSVMRGVSRTAVAADVPVLGGGGVRTGVLAQADAACPWYAGVSSLAFVSPNATVAAGARAFEASLFAQYRAWGVDAVEYDCVYGADFAGAQVAQAAAQVAGHAAERATVLGVAPGDGAPPAEHAEAVKGAVNAYRVAESGEGWAATTRHFGVAAEHAATGLVGYKGRNGRSWPDHGALRWTQLTHGEQRVQFTLWSIARSPLVFGSDATQLVGEGSGDGGFALGLLSNVRALAANGNSSHNRQIQAKTDSAGALSQVVWAATGTAPFSYYVAFFNLAAEAATLKVYLNEFQTPGLPGLTWCLTQDAYTGVNGTTRQLSYYATEVAPHDVSFVYFFECGY